MDEHERWRKTLHLTFLDGRLNGAAVCEGTVSDVARRTMLRHHPDATLVSRTFPLGESDWPVELVYEAPASHGFTTWRHVFRRPDEPWPMADALALTDAVEAR